MQIFDKLLSSLKPKEDISINSVKIDDKELPVVIKENNRAKRMILRLSPDKSKLNVTVPIGSRSNKVHSFIINNKPWIADRLKKAEVKNSIYDYSYEEGSIILFKGIDYQLVKGIGRGITHTDIDEHNNHRLIIYGDDAHWPRRIADFFKKEVKKEVMPLIEKFSKQLDIGPKKVIYKDTKSRWGSCSSDGTISFSWRIIMAPSFVLHYLVAHEMSHLIEMNHSDNFWKLCKTLDSDMEKGRQWLKNNGHLLFKWEFS